MNRLLTILFMLGLFSGPAFGRTVTGDADPVSAEYTFRFVAGEDMFYVPWNGNDQELSRLEACVDRYLDKILDGRVPLYVEGYCNSARAEAENLAIARIRSNRVKSELIVRKKLTEACFVTSNHASGGDFVIVRLTVPSDADADAPDRTETGHLEADTRVAAPDAGRAAAAEPSSETAVPQTSGEEAAVAPSPDPAPATAPAASGLGVRANLLRWATLTPDLGIEWRICDRWSVGVNGSWTSWTWRDKERRYALWEVAPEVRYYMGARKRGYLGVMFKTGEFNYKLSETGRQGDLVGGGLTGGYVVPLGKSLSLDLTLGLGYLNADYEKYIVVEGVRVRQGTGSRDWWGPINAGVTLVWKLF